MLLLWDLRLQPLRLLQVKNLYYSAVTDLLKKHTGAKRCAELLALDHPGGTV